MTRLDELFNFSQTALKVHAYRQQLIASNIANADTPGYKARDIDFAAVLKDVQAAQTKPQLQPVRASGPDATPFGTELLYRSVVQRSVDGNSVDLDIERSHFAENAVRYEAQLTFVSSQIKAMLAAIQG
jgi:flagellar basal-body rod protein FlgB